MPAPVDTLLTRMIGILEAKQKAIAEAIQALQVLKVHADLFPPDAVRQHIQDVFSQGENGDHHAGQGSLFSPNETSCESIEAEQEAKEEEVTEAVAGTHYARIVSYFLSVDNKDSTTADIREATNLTRSALSAVLYRTHRKYFIQSTRPGYERMTLWRMELGAYEVAKLERDAAQRKAFFFKLREKCEKDSARGDGQGSVVSVHVSNDDDIPF